MNSPAAIILAAGCGRRLAGVADDRPKGLIELSGRSLVDRILGLLHEREIRDVTLVTGFRRHLFQPLIERSGAREVINPEFAHTGTLRSLALALDGLNKREIVVIESDLFFDERGLDALLKAPSPNVVLASGPTGAGDEVWICAPEGRVLGLSKTPSLLRSADAEFVGLTRLSTELASALSDQNGETGSKESSYDTDGLHRHCAAFDVRLCLLRDLLWGEIDDSSHLVRVRDHVHPAYLASRRAL